MAFTRRRRMRPGRKSDLHMTRLVISSVLPKHHEFSLENEKQLQSENERPVVLPANSHTPDKTSFQLGNTSFLTVFN